MAGTDHNPWRRFLALPNESRTKTLVMAFLVSGICALMVSGATVLLRPIQTANRAAEEQARIAELVRGIPGMTDLLEQSGGTLSTVVIDLDDGRAAQDVTTETFATVLADTANWTALEPAADIAGLAQRPDYAQIFLLRTGEEISLVLLPLTGQGYGGRIDAILALEGDMNTIAGIAITGHSETPGLGGRIEDPSWQARFPGTLLRDEGGELRFGVARGTASTPYQVDGITGATRTGRGVSNMVQFWLGPDGYGPLLRAINRGEF
ncbi:FMN-binding protein [Pseudooceanicola algae]|uniref:Na(+)-translocating NADH-quinone reductase subunit C n=1 Tax=Pseudooceanicola algae TaxID=1537215 RepID=A0A418SD70_9RHOB|nr:FMN-binding protein [Pseudooceanicola algae]QPM92306.1 Na(+)-translocating NADH-quinone reductase subunit C [Pseudooceanicola algae]